ncbi:MAG: GNAT family N-acetyltransferase [Actinomycetota bacterium]
MTVAIPDPDALARTIAFEREVVASVSTRLVPFTRGIAYLNDRYPERWDSNFLWVDHVDDAVADAGELTSEADRVLGEAGLIHREIRIDDDAYGRSVAADLAGAGYGGDRLVVMVLRRPADRPDASGAAEEVDLATLRPALEIVLRREPWATTEEIVRILADFRGELQRHAGARFFCARVDGEIAGMCELYAQGSIAQIEDVNTLEEFRDRGLARAVVRRAANEAMVGGAALVFLHALDDDWPKELYAKLGFDPIGYVWSFVRPPGASSSVKSPA